MELTAADHEAFEGRSRDVDHARRDAMHFLGSYRRALPVNLQRMMENAYDWEHLPFVHPSSFADIALVEQGRWGWRCKAALPGGAGTQAIELLVDRPNHYWATTVVEGFGQGVEIHTQASEVDTGGIEVDVRFYLPEPPESEAQADFLLAALQSQYATLYDEDEALMSGRQAALDAQPRGLAVAPGPDADLGAVTDFDRDTPTLRDVEGAALVVRNHEGQWVAHSAVCPHRLGPLESAAIENGAVVCPWHGYRFSLSSGAEEQGRCGKLPILAQLEERDGRLVVRR